MHSLRKLVPALAILLFSLSPASAQSSLSPDLQQKIDKIAADALLKSGVPSADRKSVV